ncbi:hypothetical protein [Paraburkholderia bryophila]|uniref:hypothetical protein n=1 Tax=Paraburkholderia bryophila TaxID=420952 RepID=UPI001C536E39
MLRDPALDFDHGFGNPFGLPGIERVEDVEEIAAGQPVEHDEIATGGRGALREHGLHRQAEAMQCGEIRTGVQKRLRFGADAHRQ